MATVEEKCGIFGVFGKGLDVSRLSFFGLFALQHRGQENSGIAASNGTTLRAYKNAGLVPQVYTEEIINDLPGHIAIGHNRYSTFGGTGLGHTQPVVIDAIFGAGKANGKGITVADGLVTFAHNGNLPSVTALENFLKGKGIDTPDLSDSEMMAEAIGYHVRRGKSLPDAVQEALSAVHRRLLRARHDQGHGRCVPRCMRHPAARDRQAERRFCFCVRDLRVPRHRRGVHPRSRSQARW